MRLKNRLFVGVAATFCMLWFVSCGSKNEKSETPKSEAPVQEQSALPKNLAELYTPFTLTADLSGLTENQKNMLPILIEVSQIMDDIFWEQAYGDKQSFLSGIEDSGVKRFAEINYGPWDRLDGNKPFVEGVGEKPLGAQFYPHDAMKDEVEEAAKSDPSIMGLYTVVRRGDEGKLTSEPYHVAYKEKVEKAAGLLKKAAELADDEGFKNYLNLRAEALLTDNYYNSDLAWMDMKSNAIDFVVGPVEVYEDKLFNAKAAHTAYLLIKDKEWSERLAHYAALLPKLQEGLPVDEKYKQDKPGSDSDLNAYDVVYYAGDCNAGSKTIAINLPNDIKVQDEKGSRRLQLKNAMRAKFDKILVPIADALIVPEQRKHITFDAFFSNTMFHEVAHGLGVKNTVNGKGPVDEALKEQQSALEEGKADILGLYMITSLLNDGELEGDVKDFYVTFIAGIFRSVRFGASSAHGKANMLRFNFFQEMGAFSRDPETGLYQVHFDKVDEAMTALTRKILTLQGDGDYDGVVKLMEEKGSIGETLAGDLKRLADASIPTDVVFNQGLKQLGLK